MRGRNKADTSGTFIPHPEMPGQVFPTKYKQALKHQIQFMLSRGQEAAETSEVTSQDRPLLYWWHVKRNSRKTNLEHVDIKSSHWSRVLVFLGDYYLSLSIYDFGWVIQNDISIFTPSNEDSRHSVPRAHAVRAPDQLVVPVRHKGPHSLRTIHHQLPIGWYIRFFLTPAKVREKHPLHFSLRTSLCTYNPFHQEDMPQFCSLTRGTTCRTNNTQTDNISNVLAEKSGKCSQLQ